MADDRKTVLLTLMQEPLPTIAVLGGSGLIGQALASSLLAEGFPVVPIARRFNRAQLAAWADRAVQSPIVALDTAALEKLLEERKIDIVVNCLGVLQDGSRGRTNEVHRDFVARLLAALAARQTAALLIQLSIPGRPDEDVTPFSRTKREAEGLIASGSIPYVILRPGFVIAPAAYGGSALIRALAALPVGLPSSVADRPFRVTNVADLARTITVVARSWQSGEQKWAAAWDVMDRNPSSLGEVVNGFRQHFGGPRARFRLPSPLMDVGAKLGDVLATLGWAPPIRTNALAELRRGVSGDPEAWIAATAIQPLGLNVSLAGLSSSVQEKWFARLYLAKAGIIGILVLFWVASGLIALLVSFSAASAILTLHGFSQPLADAATVISSLADIAVGLAIGARRTCRAGLICGIALSLLYMASALLLTPELWVEPLGALVKTGPAIMLMLVAILIADDR